jgi:hypothetical protein
MPHALIPGFLTAHSLHSFEAQRTLSFFFLSADPGGIGSAFHWAEEGRKEKTATLRDLFVKYLLVFVPMTYGLAITDPPEADCFSFAVACIPACGAAQRQMKIIYFSAIFAA